MVQFLLSVITCWNIQNSSLVSSSHKSSRELILLEKINPASRWSWMVELSKLWCSSFDYSDCSSYVFAVSDPGSELLVLEVVASSNQISWLFLRFVQENLSEYNHQQMMRYDGYFLVDCKNYSCNILMDIFELALLQHYSQSYWNLKEMTLRTAALIITKAYISLRINPRSIDCSSIIHQKAFTKIHTEMSEIEIAHHWVLCLYRYWDSDYNNCSLITY